MPAFRVIPCLDVSAGRVVKGVNFVNLRDMGEPAELARRYRDEGADELVFLDITATVEEREALRRVVAAVAEVLDLPFTVGGGVRSEDDAETLLRAGADKVSVNSAAVADPELLTRLARRFGSQCVVLAIDARIPGTGHRAPGAGPLPPGAAHPQPVSAGPRTPDPGPRIGGWEVVTHGGRRATGVDAVEWAREGASRGAGEILLTSMDRDGTGAGFDVELLSAVRAAAAVPLIASGGGETAAHFAAAARAGADAGLAATIFHEARVSIGGLKRALAASGIPVRLEHP
jgi:imidazole glycerol-phosphate synthase subunit HisF